MKFKYVLSCFLWALIFVQPAAAKVVPDFRCEVRLSETNEDILSHWEAFNQALDFGSLGICLSSDETVGVEKQAEGYIFSTVEPLLIFHYSKTLGQEKLFDIQMKENHWLVQTQQKRDLLHLEIDADEAFYQGSAAHKRLNMEGSFGFSLKAIYDLNTKSYKEQNWQIDAFDSRIIHANASNQAHIVMEKITFTHQLEGLQKIDLVQDIHIKNLKIKHLSSLGERQALNVKEAIGKQILKQADTEFWRYNTEICLKSLSADDLLNCIFASFKNNELGMISKDFQAKDILYKFYPLEDSSREIHLKNLSSQIKLNEKNKRIGGSIQLKGEDINHKALSLKNELASILPREFYYGFAFMDLDKNKIDKAENISQMNITQMPIISELMVKAQDNQAINFTFEALFSEDTGFTLADILYKDYAYFLNNIKDSHLKAMLKVTEQARIVEALAPILPIGKNMVNLFLGMYGKKIENQPPQHYYELTIKEGKPRINGKGVGLRF